MATENSIGLDEALLTQLCEAICDRNPYRNNMQLSANWRDEIEQDYYQAGYWKFKDRSLRVAKAIYPLHLPGQRRKQGQGIPFDRV